MPFVKLSSEKSISIKDRKGLVKGFYKSLSEHNHQKVEQMKKTSYLPNKFGYHRLKVHFFSELSQ